MLSIKLIGLLNLREFAHLQFRNGETVLINSINDFTSLSVTVRFDHSESSFRFGFKLLSSEKITVFNEFKLSRVDVNDRSNEQYVGGDTWASHSFHEHSSIFEIIHFASSISWIISEKVLSNEFSLSIKPFCFENESLFLDNT